MRDLGRSSNPEERHTHIDSVLCPNCKSHHGWRVGLDVQAGRFIMDCTLCGVFRLSFPLDVDKLKQPPYSGMPMEYGPPRIKL